MKGTRDGVRESSILMNEKLGLLDRSLLIPSAWHALTAPLRLMASGCHAALHPEQVAPGHKDNEPLHLGQRIQLWTFFSLHPFCLEAGAHLQGILRKVEDAACSFDCTQFRPTGRSICLNVPVLSATDNPQSKSIWICPKCELGYG